MSWGRTPADRWFLGVVAAAGAVLAAVIYFRDPSSAVISALFLILHVFCLVPVVAIALAAAKLTGVLRYFFALTAVPVFLVLLICSIFLISGEFPSYFEKYNQAMAGGGHRRGMWWGIVATVPAAIAFWLWYRILRLVDRAIHRDGR
jgi:hypothetical protein